MNYRENLSRAEELSLYLDAAEHEVEEGDWEMVRNYLSRISRDDLRDNRFLRERFRQLSAHTPFHLSLLHQKEEIKFKRRRKRVAANPVPYNPWAVCRTQQKRYGWSESKYER